MAEQLTLDLKLNDSSFKSGLNKVTASFVKVTATANKMNAAINKSVSGAFNKISSSISKTLPKTSAAFKKISSQGKEMGKNIAKAGAVAAAGIAAVAGGAYKLLQHMDDIQGVRNLFGDNPQAFEQMRDFAIQAGTSQEEFLASTTALQKGLKNIAQVQQAQKVFADIGYNANFGAGKLAELSEKFAELGTKKTAMGDLEALARLTGVDLVGAFKDVNPELIKTNHILDVLEANSSKGAAGLVAMEEAQNSFGAQVNTAFGYFSKFAEEVGKDIFGDSRGFVKSFIAPLVKELPAAFDKVRESINSTISVFKTVSDWMQKNEKLVKVLSGALLGALVPVVWSLVTALGSAAVAAWAAISPWLIAAAPFIAVGAAIAALVVYWDDVVKVLKVVGSWMWETIKTVSFFFPPLHALILAIELVAENWDKIWASVKNTASEIGGWLGGIWDSIVKFFTPIGSKMLEIGGQIIDGLVNGILAGFSGLTKAIKTIDSIVIGGIKRLFGIASPSKEMEKLGRFTAEGFNKGLDDQTLRVANKKIVQKTRNETLKSAGAPTGSSASSSSSAMASSLVSSIINNNSTSNNKKTSSPTINVKVDARGSSMNPVDLSNKIKESLKPLLYDILSAEALNGAGQ